MEISKVKDIYLMIKSCKHQGLADSLLKSAVRYARIRVDWLLSDNEQRADMEAERTSAHNAFISQCDILARNMANAGEDTTWRKQIGADRKDIGDFACLLHAVMGINAR
jgi:hypothetical protein